jgi:hypothetical protein
MRLDLSDEETATLLRELDAIVDGDRFPLSPIICSYVGQRKKNVKCPQTVGRVNRFFDVFGSNGVLAILVFDKRRLLSVCC